VSLLRPRHLPWACEDAPVPDRRVPREQTPDAPRARRRRCPALWRLSAARRSGRSAWAWV